MVFKVGYGSSSSVEWLPLLNKDVPKNNLPLALTEKKCI